MKVELTQRVELRPGDTREAGARVDLPTQAALALVAGNAARHVVRDDQQAIAEAIKDDEGADSEPEEPDGSDESVDWSALDWTSIDGVGAATAEAIVEYLEGSEIDSLDALADTDLTDLPEIGDAKRGAVESLLLEAMDADE